MKRFALLFFFLIQNINLWAQYNSIPTVNEYVDDFDDSIQNISYRGGLGLFIPASNKHFQMAPFFEFNINIPTYNNYAVEFALQFGGWSRENNFTYIRRTDTLKATSRMFFNGIIKLKRDLIFFDKSFIGLGAGAGASYVLINVDVVEPQIESLQKPYKTMFSFLGISEIEYVINVTRLTQLSLSFAMQYSTYKLKSALQNDIGKWYFLPKVTYRF